MAYNETYTFSDMASITGNLIGKTGVEAKDYTSLFVLLGVFVLGAGLIAYVMRK